MSTYSNQTEAFSLKFSLKRVKVYFLLYLHINFYRKISSLRKIIFIFCEWNFYCSEVNCMQNDFWGVFSERGSILIFTNAWQLIKSESLWSDLRCGGWRNGHWWREVAWRGKCKGLQMRCGMLESLSVFPEHSVLGIGEKGWKAKGLNRKDLESCVFHLGLDSVIFNSETQNNKRNSDRDNPELVWQSGGHQELGLLCCTILPSVVYLLMTSQMATWVSFSHHVFIPNSRKKEEGYVPNIFTETSWNSFNSLPVNHTDQKFGTNSYWEAGWCSLLFGMVMWPAEN